MAALTWPEVVAHDAGLSALDPVAQDAILELVEDSVDPAMFGGVTHGQYKLARIYLAAHLGRSELTAASGAVGPVASKSVGGLSKSYFQLASDGDALSETPWGRKFKALARNSAARAGLLI